MLASITQMAKMGGFFLLLFANNATAQKPSPVGTWYLERTKVDGTIQRGILELKQEQGQWIGQFEAAWHNKLFSGSPSTLRLVLLNTEKNVLSAQLTTPVQEEWKLKLGDDDTMVGNRKFKDSSYPLRAQKLKSKQQFQIFGSYRYRNNSAKEQEIEKKIYAATEAMNFVARPIARNRLEFLTRPAKYFSFEKQGKSIKISNPQVERRCSLSGETVRFEDRRGKASKATCSRFKIGLEEHFSSDGQGRWVHDFAISKDGKVLYQTVLIDFPKFPKPITYTIAYERTTEAK